MLIVAPSLRRPTCAFILAAVLIVGLHFATGLSGASVGSTPGRVGRIYHMDTIGNTTTTIRF